MASNNKHHNVADPDLPSEQEDSEYEDWESPNSTEIDVLVGNAMTNMGMFRMPKELLATHSDYFRAALSGNYEEKNVVHLMHEDLDIFGDVCLFLEHLQDLPEKKVVEILRFSVVHGFGKVADHCEDLLIAKNIINKQEKLMLADELSLKKLMFHCLENTNSLKDLREFFPVNVSTISQTTLAYFLHRILTVFGIQDRPNDMKDPTARTPKPKKFTLRLAVSKNLAEVTREDSAVEEHFGADWFLSFLKTEHDFGVFVTWWPREDMTPETSISVAMNFKILSMREELQFFETSTLPELIRTENSCGMEFGTLASPGRVILEKAMTDSTFVLEANVEIGKMEGFYERNFVFDEDVAGSEMIEVGGWEFYVSPSILSTFSTYFHSLFSGEADESKNKKVDLRKESAEHFQSLLEIIDGYQVIDDENVMCILELADKLGVEKAMEQCEDFIIDSNTIFVKEKVRLADKFRLRKLLLHCLNNIHNFNDLKAYIPVNVFRLQQPTLALFLHKILNYF